MKITDVSIGMSASKQKDADGTCFSRLVLLALGIKDAQEVGGERQKQEQANITRSAVTAVCL